MNQFFAATLDFNATAETVESTSLVFVDDAEYEFVGGGAAAVNNL